MFGLGVLEMLILAGIMVVAGIGLGIFLVAFMLRGSRGHEKGDNKP